MLTVLDWEQGRFQLAFEPERRRRKTEVAQQNRALADVLYELLKRHIDERLLVGARIADGFCAPALGPRLSRRSLDDCDRARTGA